MNIDDIIKELENSESNGRKNESSSESKESVYKKLVQVWVNERTAPELLPYQEEVIEKTFVRLREQIEIIELNSIELETRDADIKLKLHIIENEVERINFLVRSYLRCRLNKIDKFSVYIRDEDGELDKLSMSETRYMEKHLKILTDLYNGSFLKDLPDGLQEIDDTRGAMPMVEKPNLDQFVFVRVVHDHARPIRFGDQEIALDKDDIHTVQYKLVKTQLENQEVVLI